MNKISWNEKDFHSTSDAEDATNNPDKIQAFDALFTNNQIQICKILLPYLEPTLQKSLAIYIKCMELQYTLTHFSRNPEFVMPAFACKDNHQICDEIHPFLNPVQQKQVEQFTNMFANMNQIREMMEMAEMMKEMFPEGFSFGENESGNDSTPDISQILQMFGGLK